VASRPPKSGATRVLVFPLRDKLLAHLSHTDSGFRYLRHHSNWAGGRQTRPGRGGRDVTLSELTSLGGRRTRQTTSQIFHRPSARPTRQTSPPGRLTLPSTSSSSSSSPLLSRPTVSEQENPPSPPPWCGARPAPLTSKDGDVDLGVQVHGTRPRYANPPPWCPHHTR
jgi:hypothetical protein